MLNIICLQIYCCYILRINDDIPSSLFEIIEKINEYGKSNQLLQSAFYEIPDYLKKDNIQFLREKKDLNEYVLDDLFEDFEDQMLNEDKYNSEDSTTIEYFLSNYLVEYLPTIKCQDNKNITKIITKIIPIINKTELDDNDLKLIQHSIFLLKCYNCSLKKYIPIRICPTGNINDIILRSIVNIYYKKVPKFLENKNIFYDSYSYFFNKKDSYQNLNNSPNNDFNKQIQNIINSIKNAFNDKKKNKNKIEYLIYDDVITYSKNNDISNEIKSQLKKKYSYCYENYFIKYTNDNLKNKQIEIEFSIDKKKYFAMSFFILDEKNIEKYYIKSYDDEWYDEQGDYYSKQELINYLYIQIKNNYKKSIIVLYHHINETSKKNAPVERPSLLKVLNNQLKSKLYQNNCNLYSWILCSDMNLLKHSLSNYLHDNSNSNDDKKKFIKSINSFKDRFKGKPNVLSTSQSDIDELLNQYNQINLNRRK